MKPPTHSPSFAAGSDMADIEQPLLQAARDLPQAGPGPALDAVILGAAAQRAEEVRRARTIVVGVPAANPGAAKTRPSLERFSRWLFGDGGRRGHFRQALAASIVAGIALGIVWLAERENAPTVPDVAMMGPIPEPATAAITRGEVADSTAVEAKADKIQLAAASSALPSPPMEARWPGRTTEPEPLPAAAPVQAAAPAPPKEEVAEQQADRSRAAPMVARQAAPSPMRDAAKPARDVEKARKINVEAEIDAQLKRIRDLRRAGKEKESQDLLRQLRLRYPDGNIDERLRQREKEENQ